MRYTGDEHFTFEGMPTNHLLSDFWAWFSSDLLNNTTRGILAEYIVASALELDTSGQRQVWDAFDVTYGDTTVEVKSSAYLQSWNEGKRSSPIFGIAPTYVWNDREVITRSRKADIYVFCLFAHDERETAEPMRLEQWRFFVLPTSTLNEKCGEQKTITLNSLISLSPREATYETLKRTIDELCKK